VLASNEYASRQSQRLSRVAHCETIHIRLGNIRLALAALAAIGAWASFRAHLFTPWWLLVPVAAFVFIAAWHSKILRARDLAQRAVAFYERGLARIEDRWSTTGESGERFDDPHHIYAADLDIFGKGSLFQLLSTARTRMGEDALASWLLVPSRLETIRERHASLDELRDQLDLREDLAVLGEDVGVGVNPDALVKWAESPGRMQRAWLRGVSMVLAPIAVVGAIVWAVWGIATPFVAVVVIEAIITYRLKKPMEEVFLGTEVAFRDMGLLSGVLARVESHSFHAPRLTALQQQLLSGGVRASVAIARLKTLVDLIDSRHNVYLRVIDAPLMYSVQLAFAAERWRRTHGEAVRRWVSAIGEMEALLSLASYSFEHPDDPFPHLDESASGARFEAEGIGHPLVPTRSCVRNDVSFAGETGVLLVSGSNMSGKSTLLRAVGMNTVLAMAGAPVRARQLRLTPLRVGASIRINDSLQEGSSRFYAEITRLREILHAASGELPLLFLLDELLQGTNSKDRRIGAEGMVRALLKRGAIGLVSTHDLALTDIAGEGHLHNVHFQDDLVNGKMTFDYKLRDGVVTKSNGLELMRSIGLEV
jgi:MutS domain V